MKIALINRSRCGGEEGERERGRGRGRREGGKEKKKTLH